MITSVAPSTELVKTLSMRCANRKCSGIELDWNGRELHGEVKAFKVDNWSYCLKCKAEWPEHRARFIEVWLPKNWVDMLTGRAS